MLRVILLSAVLWAGDVHAILGLELEGVLEVPFLVSGSPFGGQIAATDDLLVVATNGGEPGLAFFVRDPTGVAGWRLEQTVPTEGLSAVAIAGSTMVRAEAGSFLAFYEKRPAGWERVGAVAVKPPAQYLGSWIRADADRIVALAGEYPSGIEILTLRRESSTSSGWELEGRQRLIGYRSPRGLSLDGDRLGLVARVGATGRAEVFEWSDGEWLSSLVVEDSTLGGIELADDLVAIGRPFESTPPTLGSIELYRRVESADWLQEAVVTAPVEEDGFSPQIGTHIVFAPTGDLVVASDRPSGCPGDDPTCFPVLRDVRVMQLAAPAWGLRGLWQGEADGYPEQPGPDGWVGRSLVASRDQVIATTTDADRPGLRVFRIGQPSPLEVPTLSRPASVGMILVLLVSGLACMVRRRRPNGQPDVGCGEWARSTGATRRREPTW